MKSIIQKEKECYFCRTQQNLHLHHIFAGGNRKLSDKYGLVVYLCASHHNLGTYSVHNNKELDNMLKKIGQSVFESKNGHKKFMELFGKNYLE